MSNVTITTRLESIIAEISDVAIALSGGIDSLVLSAVAFSVSQNRNLKCTMFHAISPAVPEQATQRVQSCADEFGWNLRIIDAQEFSNPHYRDNPLDRCFYCKSSLYSTIRSATSSTILSGTNLDDLSEFRPGLKAAEEYGVRHPFVEAAISKQMIRQLAPLYGLVEYSELPAAPCLASRVETGISIEADELRSINAIERLISQRFACRTVRCRLRNGRVVLEIDEQSLAEVAAHIDDQGSLAQTIRNLLAGRFKQHPISCIAYRTGSAFVQVKP